MPKNITYLTVKKSVLYETFQLSDYCAKPLQQILVNNKTLILLCRIAVDIHQLFMESRIHRLCRPS